MKAHRGVVIEQKVYGQDIPGVAARIFKLRRVVVPTEDLCLTVHQGTVLVAPFNLTEWQKTNRDCDRTIGEVSVPHHLLSQARLVLSNQQHLNSQCVEIETILRSV